MKAAWAPPGELVEAAESQPLPGVQDIGWRVWEGEVLTITPGRSESKRTCGLTLRSGCGPQNN